MLIKTGIAGWPKPTARRLRMCTRSFFLYSASVLIPPGPIDPRIARAHPPCYKGYAVTVVCRWQTPQPKPYPAGRQEEGDG